MVDGVGSATTGSLRDFDLYNQYYSEYLAYNQNTGGTLSFEAYLRLKGRIGYFNEQLENFLETGNANHGDGVKGNTISDNRHVETKLYIKVRMKIPIMNLTLKAEHTV